MQQKIGKQFPEARLIQALNDFAALAQVKRAEQADLKRMQHERIIAGVLCIL